MSQPNPAYIGVRRDLIELLDERPLRTLLDVGCAQGGTASVLKQAHPALKTTGIELDPELAEVARERLDEVLCMDALEGLRQLRERGERFDVVMCGDVLEHMEDPWGALRQIRALCAPEGQVVVSLPNVGHYATIVALWREEWPYESRGIHDRTHLRWFSSKNLAPLYEQASFKETKRVVTRRLVERPHPINGKVAPYLGKIPLVRRLTAFQFLSRLEPT